MITKIRISQAAVSQGVAQRRRCGLAFSNTPIFLQGAVPRAIALDSYLRCEEVSAAAVKAAGAVVVSVEELAEERPIKAARVDGKDARLAELELQLGAKDARAAELELQLGAKDARAAEIELQLDAMDARVADLELQLGAKGPPETASEGETADAKPRKVKT